LDDGVDALRGLWDEERHVMVVSWLMWDGRVMSNKSVVRNLEEGCMVVCVDRE